MAKVRRNKQARALRNDSAYAVNSQGWPDPRDARLEWGGTAVTAPAEPLVSDKGNVVRGPWRDRPQELNEVPGLSPAELQDAYYVIERRFMEAEQVTEKMSDLMEKAEAQYEGRWRNPENDNDEHIYLTKTREMVDVVGAFLQQMVTQLPQLMKFQPTPKSLINLTDDWGKAKVAEALMNYYFDDVWKIRTDLLPQWIKTYLKFPLAIWGVFYRQRDFGPDLELRVVDRSQIYVDPFAHDLRHARWCIYREYVQRAEIIQNFERELWTAPPWLNWYVRGLGLTQPNQAFFNRYFGNFIQWSTPVREDDLIEVWHYYQAPRQGLSHRYGVIVGGIGGALVWYGPNPFPYKGIPFRGKAYDPHEYKVDGTGLAEMYRGIQEIVNTFLNLRLDDVRQNIHRPVALLEELVDDTTQQDMEQRQKLIRLNKDVINALRQQNPNFKLGDYFAEIPINTSTGELWQDIGNLLGFGKEILNVQDVFRGQMPAKEATLGEVQQSLQQNIGVFRPKMSQVMRGLEEIAEICFEYFKDADFFGDERIVTILGQNNKYEQIIKTGWYQPVPGVHARAVKPEEMDVDVQINAVDGAQAMLTRMMRLNSLQQLFAAMGQIPDLFTEIKDQFDWSKIVLDVLMTGPEDLESIQRTPQEVQQLQAQRQNMAQAQQQQQLAFQVQLNALLEKAKHGEITKSKIAVDTNRAQLEQPVQMAMLHEQGIQALEQIVAKGSIDKVKLLLQKQKEMESMLQEFLLEQTLASHEAQEARGQSSAS